LQRKTKYRIYYLHELYGEYYNKKLNFISAVHSFNDALEDAELVYSDNQEFPAIPRIYKRRANNYVKLDSIKLAFNDYQSGLRYFDKSLDDDWSFNPSFKISSSAPVGLDLLTAKATYASDLFKETSDTTYLTIAKGTYRAAMNLIDAMRLSYINEGSKYYIVAQAQSLYKEYIELLVSAEEHMPKDEWSEEIYNTIQRNKNSVLIERIKEKVAVLSSNLPDDVKNKESKLRSDISFYTKLLSEVDKSDSTALVRSKSHEENLFKAKEDFAILSNNLKSEYPEYYALANTAKEYYSLGDVKKAVQSDEAIIEYFAMDGGYLTLTISDSDVQVNVLQDEYVSRLLIYYLADVSQSPVISGKSISDLSIQSEQLYTRLLGSIRGLEDIDQLYIIPDGMISKLPFSSLIDPETKEYLISEKSISYLLSVDQFMNQE
jgi:tetratricopeptide (TPR) repeat protein